MITELKDGQQVRIGEKYYKVSINNKRPSFRLFGYTTLGLKAKLKKIEVK